MKEVISWFPTRSIPGIVEEAMKGSDLKSEVEKALRLATQELQKKDGERVRIPPLCAPPDLALQPHFYALLKLSENPAAYSAILQHFLQKHNMPIPSGVFKRRFFEPPKSDAFSPDGVSSPVYGPEIGRPSLGGENLQLYEEWVERGKPSFADLFRELNPKEKGKHKPDEVKRGADKLRQRIKSAQAAARKGPK
jgi:hypothetical protein